MLPATLHPHSKNPKRRKLDKQAPTPYYVQIAEILGQRVAQGVYPRDTFLPSEAELAREFGVTRMTVRGALRVLQEQGKVRTERGRGTRVSAAKLELSLLHFYSVGRDIPQTGREIRSRVLQAERVQAPAQVARALALPVTGPVSEIVRLRALDEVPFILERSYLPASWAPGIEEQDLTDASIYELLEQTYGLRVAYARESIQPLVVAAGQAELLELTPGTAAFLVERVCFGEDEQPLEYRRSVIRSDLVTFTAELR